MQAMATLAPNDWAALKFPPPPSPGQSKFQAAFSNGMLDDAYSAALNMQPQIAVLPPKRHRSIRPH